MSMSITCILGESITGLYKWTQKIRFYLLMETAGPAEFDPLEVCCFFFFFSFKVYLFILFFGCCGSLFLCAGFFQLWQAEATLHCGTWASHCSGFSCCTQALGTWALGVAAHGSVAAAFRLSFSVAGGILPDQGCLALQGGFLNTGPSGKPSSFLFI